MTPAFWIFMSFYIVAAVLTWIRYIRRPLGELADGKAADAVGAG